MGKRGRKPNPSGKSFIRTGHGNGGGVPRVEISPYDEISFPIAGELAVLAAPVNRHQNGQIADRESAKALGRKGGLAKANRVRLVDNLGLSTLAEDAAFTPYRRAAEAFVAHHLTELAQLAGGSVGSAASTMVSTAALQLASSRYCFDLGAKTGDVLLLKTGSSLGNDSRQNLLAAYELAVRESSAKPKIDALDEIRKALGGTHGE